MESFNNFWQIAQPYLQEKLAQVQYEAQCRYWEGMQNTYTPPLPKLVKAKAYLASIAHKHPEWLMTKLSQPFVG